MERIQRNGGTAGFVTAVCLALLFIVFASSGLDMQAMQDPAKALPALGQKSGVFASTGVLGFLASGFGLVFTFGIWVRLREKSPTRAVATLGLAFMGLTAHAAGAALLWQGGATLVALSARDQTAAAHAWAALGAVNQGLMAMGNAFTGAAALVAGWAIIATGAMGAALGWVAVVAGVLEILQVFSAQMALMGLGFLFVIIWLAWGGAQLRRSPA
ncbi:MAG TPA: hypothetical protein VKW09_04055 [bacterium]|nr:hypothetical protein [bacterium]